MNIKQLFTPKVKAVLTMLAIILTITVFAHFPIVLCVIVLVPLAALALFGTYHILKDMYKGLVKYFEGEL